MAERRKPVDLSIEELSLYPQLHCDGAVFSPQFGKEAWSDVLVWDRRSFGFFKFFERPERDEGDEDMNNYPADLKAIIYQSSLIIPPREEKGLLYLGRSQMAPLGCYHVGGLNGTPCLEGFQGCWRLKEKDGEYYFSPLNPGAITCRHDFNNGSAGIVPVIVGGKLGPLLFPADTLIGNQPLAETISQFLPPRY